MVWDLIWSTSSFYKSETKKVKRGGKSGIQPNWCCQHSITVLSTPPSSMSEGHIWMMWNFWAIVFWTRKRILKLHLLLNLEIFLLLLVKSNEDKQHHLIESWHFIKLQQIFRPHSVCKCKGEKRASLLSKKVQLLH